MPRPDRRTRTSVNAAKSHISTSGLSHTEKKSITQLITDLDERLQDVEEELDQIHKRLAFGQVKHPFHFDYYTHERKSNLCLLQIPYALQEKILRFIRGNNNPTEFWRNGIRDVETLSNMFAQPRKYRHVFDRSLWTQMEQRWKELFTIISSMKHTHEIAGDIDGVYLDSLIKIVKQDRDILAHSGFRHAQREELVLASQSMDHGTEFRFLLDLNVLISEKRGEGESIYDYKAK